MGDEVPLEDIPSSVAQQLPYNHPALNDFADRLSTRIGLPGMINSIKNAGEQSNSGQVSPKGAAGVMQFMPGTAARYGKNVSDVQDPMTAMQTAGQYLADIAKKLGTTDPAILAAGYNAGENRPSLQRGQIPPIPETQNYVQRVLGYHKAQLGEEAPAEDLPEVPASDIPENPTPVAQADIRTLVSPKAAPVHSTPAQANTTRQIFNPFGANFTYQVGPKTANFLSGLDKGAADPISGVVQRGKELANAISNKLGAGNVADPGYRDQAAQDAYNQPLLNTPQGTAGYMTGSGMDSALLAYLSPLSAAGGLGRAALAGSASGASMPVSNPTDVGVNAATGAVVGPLMRAAGAGAGKVGSALAQIPGVRQGTDYVLTHLPTMPGVLGRSVASQLTAPDRAAVQEALNSDIPVWRNQVLRKTPLTKDQQTEQATGLAKAVSNSAGQDTSDLVSAWQNARQQLSQGYNQLLHGREIPLGTDHMQDVANLMKANVARAPRFEPNSDVQDALKRAYAAAETEQSMSGKDYQQVMRQYNALATKLFNGTPEKPSDPYSANVVVGLMDSLKKQAANTMSPGELERFSQLNTQWRNMTQLETLIPKSADGTINPKALANKLASKRPDEFVYGQGDQTLPNLGRFAATYMGATPEKTGTWASAKRVTAAALPFLVGDIGGGVAAGMAAGQKQADLGGLATDAVIGLPAGAALLGLAAYKRRAGNPLLTPGNFYAPGGVAGRTMRGMLTPGALTRSAEEYNLLNAPAILPAAQGNTQSQ